MFRIVLPAALLLLAACGSTQEAPAAELTVEEIVANHIEATGGAEVANALQNIRLAAEIVEPEFTVSGDYRATRDGWMRVDVFADGALVFSEGIDGEGGWQQGGTGGEITTTSETAMAALAHGVEYNLFGLHELEARGSSVRLDGRERIDGIDYFVVELTLADGFQRYLYINPENWMIDRHRETSALHPDLDDEERAVETIESDFREMCGVLRSTASRKVDLATGEEIQRSRVTSFDCNVDPASLDIARPGGE